MILRRKEALFDTRPELLLRRLAGEPVPLVASVGGGVNSTAGLILLRRLGIVPDACLFADTAAEKAATYKHIEELSAWCVVNGFPAITTVRRDVDHSRQKHEEKYDTLEKECLVKRSLPSIAYFGRSCSIKWKHTPQDKWANAWDVATEWKAKGEPLVKAIFFDADEPGRAKIHESSGYQFWYPLLDYDWGREECEEAIRSEGMNVPPKSSCFFCPEMTPNEIFELGKTEPDLLQRALAMEANASLTSIKGLGKHEYSWRDLVDGKVPLEVIQRANKTKALPCMCHDG